VTDTILIRWHDCWNGAQEMLTLTEPPKKWSAASDLSGRGAQDVRVADTSVSDIGTINIRKAAVCGGADVLSLEALDLKTKGEAQ
jgi:hypothetical protein